MPKYEVRLVYRGVHTYIVEAPDPATAKHDAMTSYQKGENGVPTGSEWEEIDNMACYPLPPEISR